MRRWIVALSLVGLASGCGDQNAGAVFNLPPPGGGGGPGPGPGGGGLAVPIQGGVLVAGSPTVVSAGPTGMNANTKTVAAVVFSESIDAATLTPGSIRLQPLLGAPVAGAIVPFAANRLVVFVPSQDLASETAFNLVVASTIRDLEGNPVQVPPGGVVASFTPVAGDPAPSVVVVFPQASATNMPRTDDVFAVFSRPVLGSSLEQGFFALIGGNPVPATVAFAPSPVPQVDLNKRVARLDPVDPLPLDTLVTVRVTAQILGDGGGFLALTPEFTGTFRVSAFEAPVSVHALPFANAGNAAAFPVQVRVGSGFLAGDAVRLIVHEAAGTGAVTRQKSGPATANCPQAGQTCVDFSGPDAVNLTPLLDGVLVAAAYVVRGTLNSAMVLLPTPPGLRKDTVPPQVVQLGPPVAPPEGSAKVLLTPLRRFAVTGFASESLKEVTVDTGPSCLGSVTVVPPELSMSGLFFFGPVFDAGPYLEGTLPPGSCFPDSCSQAPDCLPITVTAMDQAGNVSDPVGGIARFRGFASGPPVAGTLRVRAFRGGTLLTLGCQVSPPPACGAGSCVQVVVDPVPAGPQQCAVVGPDGVAAFAGLPASSHTVTLAQGISDLVTVVATPASFLSVGLPTTAAPGVLATLLGAVTGEPTNSKVVLASNAFPDPGDVHLFPFGPSNPSAPIAANRVQAVTAFAGPPSPGPGQAIYTHFSCLPPFVCNPLLPSLFPIAPVDPGDTAIATATLVAEGGHLVVPQTIDLATAAGLDPGAVNEVRLAVNARKDGLSGLLTIGLGFASPSTTPPPPPTLYDGVFETSTLAFTTYSSVLHAAASAEHADGTAASMRRVPTSALPGTIALPPLPTIVPPGGPVAAPPTIQFADSLGAAPGLYRVRIRDDAIPPRAWTLYLENAPSVATVSVTVPTLPAGIAGLKVPGSWTVSVEAFEIPGFAFGSFHFTDASIGLATFARSPSVVFQIQ